MKTHRIVTRIYDIETFQETIKDDEMIYDVYNINTDENEWFLITNPTAYDFKLLEISLENQHKRMFPDEDYEDYENGIELAT